MGTRNSTKIQLCLLNITFKYNYVCESTPFIWYLSIFAYLQSVSKRERIEIDTEGKREWGARLGTWLQLLLLLSHH